MSDSTSWNILMLCCKCTFPNIWNSVVTFQSTGTLTVKTRSFVLPLVMGFLCFYYIIVLLFFCNYFVAQDHAEKRQILFMNTLSKVALMPRTTTATQEEQRVMCSGGRTDKSWEGKKKILWKQDGQPFCTDLDYSILGVFRILLRLGSMLISWTQYSTVQPFPVAGLHDRKHWKENGRITVNVNGRGCILLLRLSRNAPLLHF